MLRSEAGQLAKKQRTCSFFNAFLGSCALLGNTSCMAECVSLPVGLPSGVCAYVWALVPPLASTCAPVPAKRLARAQPSELQPSQLSTAMPRGAASRKRCGGGGKRTRAAAARHKAVQDMVAMAERLCLATALYEPEGEGFLRLRKGDLIWALGKGRNGYIRACNMLTRECGLVPLSAVSKPLFARAPWAR